MIRSLVPFVLRCSRIFIRKHRPSSRDHDVDHSLLATEEVFGQVLNVRHLSVPLLLHKLDSHTRISLLLDWQDLDGLDTETLRGLLSLRTSFDDIHVDLVQLSRYYNNSTLIAKAVIISWGVPPQRKNNLRHIDNHRTKSLYSPHSLVHQRRAAFVPLYPRTSHDDQSRSLD